ncbi:MAG: 3-phosphoshikimate 1-carboxyvinyltransferase [Nitrospirota bacterium]
MEIELSRAPAIRGELIPPPDKSISHRALMLGAIARGESVVRNFLRSADTLSTMNAFRTLGVEIEDRGDEVRLKGRGLHGLKEPLSVIDCGNSGTTMRLLAGLLAGNPFLGILSGDASLSVRPMRRVIDPLSGMGARIMARGGDRYPPMAVRGGDLKGIRHALPVASAQVKSSLLLAGLYARGETELVEPAASRDHTERMLRASGADISVEGRTIRVGSGRELSPLEVDVPGDFSSAAFFIAAAVLVEGSELIIRNVGLNPTRTGFLDALRKMGAHVERAREREVSGEPVADLIVRSSPLRAIEVGVDEIPAMIDEFPILAVAGARAEGTTVIRGAGELRVKESDRIHAMGQGLSAMGVKVEELDDGLRIDGPGRLRGAPVKSFGDHRIAMALAVASLVAEGSTVIEGAEAVDISFPGFFESLRRLAH